MEINYLQGQVVTAKGEWLQTERGQVKIRYLDEIL